MALDLCSHDAPGQKQGEPCIRCGKIIGVKPQVDTVPVEVKENLEKKEKK